MKKFFLVLCLIPVCASAQFNVTTDAPGNVLGSRVTNFQSNKLLSNHVTIETLLAAKQPLDPDLTAIAALATTSFGRISLTLTDGAAFRSYIGAGTVISASVVSANGVSATVTTSTTTPAFTFTLGAIMPMTVNGNTITVGTGTLTLGSATLNAGAGGTLGSNAFTSTAFVPQTRTVNGHALSGNISVTPTDLSLVIGTNTEAWDADLDAIAGISTTSGLLTKTAANTWSLVTDNSSNWDTAYTDRNKWDGGATGLNASTGRLSLNLGTLATQDGTFSGTSSGTNTGDQTITLTGDITGSGTGSFTATIGSGKVTNSMLAGSIAYSKLSLTGAILNADLAGSIAYSKLSLTNSIVNGDIVSLAWAKLTGVPALPFTSSATSSNWIRSYDAATGLFTKSQPAFTDISGNVAASQLPNPTAITLGGIESYAAVSHQWINAISTNGAPSSAQPAQADIAGLASTDSPQFAGLTISGSGPQPIVNFTNTASTGAWGVTENGSGGSYFYNVGSTNSTVTLRKATVIQNQNSGGAIVWQNNYDGGGIAERGRMQLGFDVGDTPDPGAGIITAKNGYRINNAATNRHFLRGNGTNFVDAAIDPLDLPDQSATYQPRDADLDVFAGITPSANVQALLGAATFAAFRISLSLDNVTNTSDANKPVSAAQQAALDLKAPLISPALTGTPTAPTASVDTNTTQEATTAFVLAQAASATPIVAGTGAAGTSTRYARADHVHPAQTTVTGNAGTATVLQTPRTINGTSFDGSANITVTAAAGTLTGATLAAGVTASSLTSAAGGAFGTAAYTASTAYATSTQGTTADNAMPKAGGTFTGDILFTDALYDIGKSGATRARDLFLSRNAVIGGTLTVTGHVTVEGVTSTGATGTAKFVFSDSPAFTTALGLTNSTTASQVTITETASNVDAGIKLVGTGNAGWYIYTGWNGLGGNSDDLQIYKLSGTTGVKFRITDAGTAIFGAAARLKVYTVSTLPAGTQGDTAAVSDALTPTFLAIVVGGGATYVPVTYNGTNWVGY